MSRSGTQRQVRAPAAVDTLAMRSGASPPTVKTSRKPSPQEM
jgi:hypothetical protein